MAQLGQQFRLRTARCLREQKFLQQVNRFFFWGVVVGCGALLEPFVKSLGTSLK